MADNKHTILSSDTRLIYSLVLDGDHQSALTVGRWGITGICAVDETGEMSYVAWFEVWKSGALYCRVNSRYVSQVLYQEGQEHHG